MSRDNEIQRNVLAEIASLLVEFGDQSYQRRIWLEGAGPEVSCFADAAVGLISGCEIDQVLDVEWEQWGLPDAPRGPLREFRRRLGEFLEVSGSDPPVEALLADPEWQEVRVLAQRALTSLREHGIASDRSHP